MKVLKFLFFILFLGQVSLAQSKYPQDYFRNPLDIPLILSGTFGELRSNHFHSGMDIKTQQVQGKKVYTAAKGYVSRIKITHWGYGKALYVTHPNGYTTVYGHLQKFAPKIEAYIKKRQYQKESFTIEVFPAAKDLPVDTNEVIAYSGNSGGSGGPHLHFEIRDGNSRPMNPMLFGIDIKDTTKPIIEGVYVYPLDKNSYANQSMAPSKLRLIPLQSGDYTTKRIEAFGTIGFGINTTDRQDLGINRNGVFDIETYLNGIKNFELEFNRFSFGESKHINRLIDYKQYKENKTRIQKLFVQPNNPLTLYKTAENNGIVTVQDSLSSIYKIKVSDFKGNDVWVTIPIIGNSHTTLKPVPETKTPYFVVRNESKTFKEGNVTVYIPSETFYDNIYLDFNVTGDTLKLHNPSVPITKNITITYDISNYKEQDKNRLFIAWQTGTWRKYTNYISTTKKGNKLIAKTKTLGTYFLASDTKAPTIEPLNFNDGKWLSKYRYLKVKLDDDISGIKNYRATVNGKWILMEYDAKTGILTHDFNDKVVTDIKNNFKIIVTDNAGNSAKFEATFFRK